MEIQTGRKYRIKGVSHYFRRKYGTSNPLILIEEKLDFHNAMSPASMLYLGRMLAEDIPSDGNTYYGKVNGLGEFVNAIELEEEGAVSHFAA